MTDAWAWPILLVLLALTLGGYLFAWRSKKAALKITGSVLTSVIVAIGAGIASVMALEISADLFRPDVPKITTVVGGIVASSAAVFLWIVFARITKAREIEAAQKRERI